MAANVQITYTNREYYEMVRCYILSGENLSAAQRLYKSDSLPRLEKQGIYGSVPNPRTIMAAKQRLLDFGQFTTPAHATNRGGNRQDASERRGQRYARLAQSSRSPSPEPSTPRSNSRGSASKDGTPKACKDSISALDIKTRRESGSSHASAETPSINYEEKYACKGNSRDSNTSGSRDSSTSSKSTSHKNKPKSKINSVADDDSSSRRGRRRANTSTAPDAKPAGRRRI